MVQEINMFDLFANQEPDKPINATNDQTIQDPTAQTVDDTPEITHSGVVAELRQSFGAKLSAIVFDCRTKTRWDWDQLYPPITPECRALPNSGIPNWNYDFNYCTHCHTFLRMCRNNPYGFDGEIWKSRLANAKQRRRDIAASTEATSINESTDNANDTDTETLVQVTDGTKAKTAKPDMQAARKEKVPEFITDEQKPIIRQAYLDGTSINKLVEEFHYPNTLVREFLVNENVLRTKAEAISLAAKQRHTEKTVTQTAQTVSIIDSDVLKKALRDYKLGISIKTIASVHSVDVNTLTTAMEQAGANIKQGRSKKT